MGDSGVGKAPSEFGLDSNGAGQRPTCEDRARPMKFPTQSGVDPGGSIGLEPNGAKSEIGGRCSTTAGLDVLVLYAPRYVAPRARLDRLKVERASQLAQQERRIDGASPPGRVDIPQLFARTDGTVNRRQKDRV